MWENFSVTEGWLAFRCAGRCTCVKGVMYEWGYMCMGVDVCACGCGVHRCGVSMWQCASVHGDQSSVSFPVFFFIVTAFECVCATACV